jgi:hypothetical protein
MMNWIRVNDPDNAIALLPAWFAGRMMAGRGSYGFLLTTGDVVRASRITAVHVSSTGTILVDVLLDHAGVPEGVDAAWRSKHFIGAPVTGAPLSTLNLNQIAMAVEFAATDTVEQPPVIEDIADLIAAPLQIGYVES